MFDTVIIRFLDLRDRNDQERERLKARKFTLDMQKQQNAGRLPPDLEQELQIIEAKLRDTGIHPPHDFFVVDPLYGGDKNQIDAVLQKVHPETGGSPFFQDKPGVRETLGVISPPRLPDHQDGIFVVAVPGGVPDPVGLLPEEIALAAAYGLMEVDNFHDPELGDRFVRQVSVARGEYTANQNLFDEVLGILIQEGTDPTAPVPPGFVHIGLPVAEVRAEQWVNVVRALRADGVTAADPLLPLKTRAALGRAVGTTDGAALSSLSISLPDLEAAADVEIVADNIRAMQAIYFASTLEDLRLFQVVDKLVELFHSGLLPLGKGKAGDFLYSYWKKSINRFTELERRNLYARTLGTPGGEAGTDSVNREFDELWMRFISAVSEFTRQFTVDELLRGRTPLAVSQEQVRKAGRDLAANLSLHGYGVAHFAAIELQTQLRESISLLSDPEIKTAYGARDMWQVIDQVATLELGGARNSVRHRTIANAGAIIIRWLAERGNLLTGAGQAQVIDVNIIRMSSLRAKGVKALDKPTDRDLVDACEQWLAVTGTQDQSVSDYAQPTVGPNQTSLPIKIPAAARDLLESVGVRANGIAK